MTRFAILKDLGKISDYEHEHWVSEKTIKKMPYLISDPIAIIEDYNEKQKNMCYIAVLNAKDEKENQVVAYLSPSKKEEGYTLILSSYGMSSGFEKLIHDSFNNNKIKYFDKKKLEDIARSFNNAVVFSSSTNNITQKEKIVKGLIQKYTENEKE